MSVMYIGPTIHGTVKHNQVFSYDARDVIGKAAIFSSLTKYLFIPMDEIAGKRKELERPGSFLNLAYSEVSKIKQEVRP